MIPYTKPKLSDLYILLQNNLLENRILHSGTYLYSPYMALPPPPPGDWEVCMSTMMDGKKRDLSLLVMYFCERHVKY